MAITLLVLLTVFFVEYFPNLPTFSLFKKNLEEQKKQDMAVRRPLQKALIIRSLDDVIGNKDEKTKSIVIDNGRENQMWVYLSKEKSNVLPKSSGMLNIQMLESVSGMSNSQVLDETDSSDEDESLETDDDSFDSDTSEETNLFSEEEGSEYLFDNT